ncbi:uncharacterized protein LOC132713694 [Ruditapes philippinarum]|uniref:uncharacterized protein LOC132713694 n=1 Tax=Ruditapes philippinarum TaxID=129788 RepID=UPI00295B5F48|nr:uncharacterized protein LOC132713694 [Ruditapes philippinarum]
MKMCVDGCWRWTCYFLNIAKLLTGIILKEHSCSLIAGFTTLVGIMYLSLFCEVLAVILLLNELIRRNIDKNHHWISMSVTSFLLQICAIYWDHNLTGKTERDFEGTHALSIFLDFTYFSVAIHIKLSYGMLPDEQSLHNTVQKYFNLGYTHSEMVGMFVHHIVVSKTKTERILRRLNLRDVKKATQRILLGE